MLIIKRFVKVFSKTDNVPKRYLNLRKSKHVKTFLRPYPNIPEILVREYSLKWNEKIIVFHTKKIAKGSWRNYRTPFKKVYYGTVKEFRQYLLDFLKMLNEKHKKHNEHKSRKHYPETKPNTVLL